ncbi:serine hydrolase domain-containing protein [Lederbergia citrisecunda]|uniref:serine hydrolase domain-containing protein n=1 Tax=Lederbergia citrisecunda TaxID=2833583 RepID=UPI003D2E0CF7
MSQWGKFEAFVEELMETEQIPGVAVALSENGKIIYKKGFGKSDVETNEPVTPETIFGIASVTKSFTALAIMKLVEEGKLQLDDAVTVYLPNFRLSGYDNIEDIKIHHLLSHTSGIATMKRMEQLNGFEEHLRYINEIERTCLGKPGEYICYNNDMFLLLGAIIEKVTGENYQDFIHKLLLDPLKMNRTTYSLRELHSFENVTTPYILEDGKVVACEWPTLGNYAVGGGIRSTVTDLLQYGNVFVGALEKELIGQSYLSKMVEPVHRISGNSFYGYGLQTTPHYSGVTVVEHGGGQPGVSSNFGFIPERGIVAAVLTNRSDVSANAIWLAAINTALDLPIDQKRSTEQHYDINPKQLQRMVGTYRSGEGTEVDISLEHQTITATVSGKTYELRASDERTLFLLPIEKPIRFFFDGENDAWAIFLGLRMLVRSTSLASVR